LLQDHGASAGSPSSPVRHVPVVSIHLVELVVAIPLRQVKHNLVTSGSQGVNARRSIRGVLRRRASRDRCCLPQSSIASQPEFPRPARRQVASTSWRKPSRDDLCPFAMSQLALCNQEFQSAAPTSWICFRLPRQRTLLSSMPHARTWQGVSLLFFD